RCCSLFSSCGSESVRPKKRKTPLDLCVARLKLVWQEKRFMKQVICGGMIGAVVLGGLVFAAIYFMTAAEGEVFHAPPAWLIAGIYGAGGAVIGLLVGGVSGAIILAVRQGGTTK